MVMDAATLTNSCTNGQTEQWTVDEFNRHKLCVLAVKVPTYFLQIGKFYLPAKNKNLIIYLFCIFT